jgi:hypothetical protein
MSKKDMDTTYNKEDLASDKKTSLGEGKDNEYNGN